MSRRLAASSPPNAGAPLVIIASIAAHVLQISVMTNGLLL
jgi:hypothetical protein